MKYWIIFLIGTIFLGSACDTKKPRISEIQMLEYTRKVDAAQFSEWLKHRDPEIRLKAIEALGRIQDTTQVTAIAEGLTDADQMVRSAAAFALGILSFEGAENLLIDALNSESDEGVREKLIEALGKSGSEKNWARLQNFLEGKEPRFQKAAAIASGIMAYRGQPPYSLITPLAKLRKGTEDPQVDWRCVYGLYRIRALKSLKAFDEAVGDQEPLVKFFALKGLEQLAILMKEPEFKKYRNQADYRPLLAKYNAQAFYRKITRQLKDSTWYVRLAALELINRLNRKNTWQDIAKKLSDPHPYVKVRAIQILGTYLNDYTHREILKVYQKERDWRVRGEALAVLARIKPLEILQKIQNELLKEPWPKSYYAIKSLENIRNAFPGNKNPGVANQATQLLIRFADNIHTAQTTQALEILVNPPAPKTDFFLGHLKTGDMAIAAIVATHFASLTPKPLEAVTPLIQAYQNFIAPRDLDAMTPILVALDSIGSPDALPFLKKQLTNSHPLIRQKAMKALRHITQSDTFKAPDTENAYLTKWKFPPISADSIYQAIFTTTAGAFTIEFDLEKAPVNVANLISLIRKKFYDGIYFHRVVPGFVIQTGDPRGDGWGGPGYSVPCEYNDLFYERGIVGVAHAGKDTGGSQLFITHTPQPHLNARYTALGKVVTGMEVVDRIMMFDQILETELSVRSRWAVDE